MIKENDFDLLRETELYILDEIERVCDVLGISFFLDAGSALGAIRHGGYIPWDDDLDIGMIRSDYNRFLSEGPNVIKNGFFIQTPQSDETSYTLFAKVKLEGTLMRQRSARRTQHEGVWVDVFPYDSVPKNAFLRSVQIWMGSSIRRLHYAKCNWGDTTDNNISLFKRIVLFALKLLSEKTLIDISEMIRTKYQDKDSGLVFPFDYKPGWVLDYSDVFPLRGVLFESRNQLVMGNVEKYLQCVYGDWRVLPPESQRTPKHDAEIIIRKDILSGGI